MQLLLFLTPLVLCVASRELLQSPFGANTDARLLYGNQDFKGDWSASDQAAAGALNASAAGQFLQAAGAVALGSVVLDGQANKQPSIRACAASCAGTTSCDTFNYCAPTVERCVASLMTLSGGSCELRSQPGVSLGRGIYVAAGTPDLSAGAPTIVPDSPIEGYASFLGISAAAGVYNFDCRATYKRGMCLLVGMPSELAAACSADSRCVGFSAFPNGSSEMPDAMGYLLSGAAGSINLVWSNLLNPAGILYINASALPAAPAPAPSASPSKQPPPSPSPSLPPSPMPPPQAATQVAGIDTPQTGSSTGGGQDFLGSNTNTDMQLLYTQDSSPEQWNASDYAAAGAPPQTNATGFFVPTPGKVSVGTVLSILATANIQACAVSCAANPNCTNFNYCSLSASDKCVVSRLGFTLAGSSCELRSQQEARLGRGIYSASGVGGLMAGAPITVTSERLPGYMPYLGIASGAGLFDFSCSASYKMGMCMRVGSVQELAAACSAEPHCIAFSAFASSSDLGAMGYLLGGAAGSVDLDRLNLINPASVLYVNMSALAAQPSNTPGVISSLQAGTSSASQPTGDAAGVKAGIDSATGSGSQGTTEQSSDSERTTLKGWPLAGVIVGAAVAAAVLGGLAGLLVLRRRRRAVTTASPASPGKLRSFLKMSATGRSPAAPEAGCNLTMLDKLFEEAPQLKECLVPANQIAICKQPDGQPISLGSGACGSVYKVTLGGATPCAAKVVDLAGENAHYFLQEVHALRKLRHTNVVNFFGVALNEEAGMILMEFMAGRDLGSAMSKDSRGPNGRLFGWYNRGKRVALEVAQGLAFLHSKSILHLDLKPQNILLTAPPGYQAKIGDCGYARLLNKTMISDLGGRIGTFNWCAPEILVGDGCNEKADIYSYGVMLWEIITGEPPQRGQLRDPRVPEECPEEVSTLWHQCCSSKAVDRPTAVDIVTCFNELQRSSPKRPGSATEKRQRPALEKPPAMPGLGESPEVAVAAAAAPAPAAEEV